MTTVKDSWVKEHTHRDGSKSYTAHVKVKGFLFFTVLKNVCSVTFKDNTIHYFLFNAESIFGQAHHFDSREAAQYRLNEELRDIERANQREFDGKVVSSRRI